MAKFRQGNLVLTSDQQIIQGSDVLIDANGVADFASLNISGTSVLDSLSATSLAISGLSTLTTLTFAAGATIDRIDTDNTLSADLDTRIPTQKAVKTYVDAKVVGAVTPGTDEAIVRYDGAASVQDSGIFIDDSNNITGVNNLDSTGDVSCNDLYVSGSTIYVGSGEIKSTGTNVELYHNTVLSLRTHTSGASIFSSSQDVAIYLEDVDDNVQAVIQTAVGGNLYLDAGTENADRAVYLRTWTGSTNENMLVANGGASVDLYYNGNMAARTRDTGIEIIDGAAFNAVRISLYEDGSNHILHAHRDNISLIISGEGSGGTYKIHAKYTPEGANEFYYNGGKVGETTTNGISGAVWG